MIPHETDIHSRLVEVMEGSYTGKDVRWAKGYVRAVREILTLWYGEAEALRVLDVARKEAGL